MLFNLDLEIFKFINQGLSNSFFDLIIPWFREKLFWVPLYAFLIVSVTVHYKRHAYIILTSAILCVIISDQLSSFVIKPLVARERPCNNASIEYDINVLAPCRNSYSFTSSHAMNHTAIATFFILILLPYVSYIRWLWFWAALVCFAQIYVGLHYPSDVTVGALIGLIIGWSVFKVIEGFYLFPLGVKENL